MPTQSPVILAILSLLASCQMCPAQVATSQPAAATFTIGLPKDSQAAYLASPAPAVVHVNALGLCASPNDWLTDADAWNFGDATPSPITDPRTGKLLDTNTALPGPVAAHLYENPGTYTITLTRTLATGQAFTYHVTLTVPPSRRTVFYIAPDGNDLNRGIDPDHPWKTAAAAVKHLANHTEFRFRRGSVYPIQSEFPMKKQDLLVDCYGDPTLPLPVIQRIAPAISRADTTLVFTFWPGQSQDVVIRHVRIDSLFTLAKAGGVYVYHNASASFGIIRGRNIAVVDCEFLNLLEGPHGDQTCTGLLFLRNRQIDPLGIFSRTLWLEGSDVVAVGNVATNSVGESPLRSASSGVIRGLIAFNDIAQQLDPAHGRAGAKAAVTLRTLCDVMVFGNRATDGDFAFDPRSDAAQDLRFVADSNAVFNSQIFFKTNVRHAIARNNAVRTAGGPCYTIDPTNSDSKEWIQDLRLEHNTGQGWLPNSRLLQVNNHTPTQLQDFVCDPATNAYTRMPMPTTLP